MLTYFNERKYKFVPPNGNLKLETANDKLILSWLIEWVLDEKHE